jgi:AraC-like DNA-binding protein
MVCERCKKMVKAELDNMGLRYFSIEIGEVTIKEGLTAEQHSDLRNALHLSGLELIETEKNEIIDKLKRTITDLEIYSDEELKTSYSDLISLRLNYNFSSLNLMFSEIAGITIEKYIIQHKIEMVKELLIYNKLNLAEIALKMHYSSVAQLSSQFKSITGLTPLHFRQLRHFTNHNTTSN